MLSEEETEAAIEAIAFLGAYFVELLDERRRRPCDDLLSALVQARESDDRLTDEEITSTAILLFAAGFETTTNLLGNGLLALLAPPRPAGGLEGPPRHRPLGGRGAAALRQPGAVQPAHRAGTGRPPRRAAGRAATASSSCRARPTTTRHASTRPDELDLRRQDNTPLSFGWGIHHCIGAALARMEGEIAFNALLARFETMELLRGRGALAPQLHAPRAARPAAQRRSDRPPPPVDRSHSSGGPMADASGPRRST